jgi:RNA polymerase sigma factor (sigma-70 family)
MSTIDPIAEAEAIADWKAGDILAGDRLVRMHAGLIHKASRRHQSARCELDDLIQICSIELLEAARSYDPTRGKFSSWAFILMEWKAGHFARAGRYVVHVGEKLQRTRCVHSRAVPLDTPIGDGVETLADRLTAPQPDAMIAVDVEALVATLPRRQQEVLRRRYIGDGATLLAIAESDGVTKERIRQIESEGIERLRQRVTA